MSTELIPGLHAKLQDTFQRGVESGDILFRPTKVEILQDDDIQFEVRLAEHLAKKPVPKSESALQDTTKDPFLPPYGPNAFVTDYQDADDDEALQCCVGAFLVPGLIKSNGLRAKRKQLNKFSVTPYHFLLCTKAFSPQSMPPSPAELYASLRILHQLATSKDVPPAAFTAIFNCGPLSGASQPHKHLQYIKLHNGVMPFENKIQAAKPSQLGPTDVFSLPVEVMPPCHYIADIRPALSQSSPSQSKDVLVRSLLAVLDAAVDDLRALSASNQNGTTQLPTETSKMSYNLVMTLDWLILVPRSQPDYVFEQEPEGQSKLSINALGYGGMLLAKSKRQIELIKQVGVKHILETTGYPRPQEQVQSSI